MLWERVHVECYSGYKVNERPVAVFFQDQRREIAEILDRWYEGGLDSSRPALYYFKVQTSEGQLFLLRYDPLFDKWFLHDLSLMN
ncbi:cytoplasmic protein [candidate division KSB1 bacterium]|nr:cytoplasmic protein [candidate division KSB1 bacterium]RQW03300.1 MAG: cytoplasmic protein [candidate division KSB1 bacterium]